MSEPLPRTRYKSRFCSVPGCMRLRKARGLCSNHYSRAKKRAHLDLIHEPQAGKLCACGEPAVCKGKCATCYWRWREHFITKFREVNAKLAVREAAAAAAAATKGSKHE